MAALKQAASLRGVQGRSWLDSMTLTSGKAENMASVSMGATRRSYRMVAVHAGVSGKCRMQCGGAGVVFFFG